MAAASVRDRAIIRGMGVLRGWPAALPVVLAAGCWMGADLGRGAEGGDADPGWTDGEWPLGTDAASALQPADGGVFDPVAELIWQDPPAFDLMGQYEAREYCDGLVHGGRDDWYLPDVTQLRGLLRDCGAGCPVQDPSCLSADCMASPACQGCPFLEGPGQEGCYWHTALSGWCHKYWSRSQLVMTNDRFWMVEFRTGGTAFMEQLWGAAVRCVRDPG
jgi:hypothetical protein